MMKVLLPRPPSLVSLSMAVLEHNVASVCAVACAALSLVLAMNISRLRKKARSLGGKEQEKAFLDGPEFAKARAVRAARTPRPRVLSLPLPVAWLGGFWRAGLAGAAQHARVHAAVLRAHAVPAHSRCHVARAHQRRRNVRSRLRCSRQAHVAAFHRFTDAQSVPTSASSIVATVSAVLYALNALAVGQRPTAARMISSWGRYTALAGLLVATVAQG